MQRKVIKHMLQEWEVKFPGRTESIFSSLRNVALSHLADTKAFDFASLSSQAPVDVSAVTMSEDWFENEIEPVITANDVSA